MVIAIILAAGKSTRFGQNKLWMPIFGKPVWYYALQAFHDHPDIDEVMMVTTENDEKKIKKHLQKYHFPKVKKIVLGGASRQESFRNAFQIIEPKHSLQDIVLAHNAANPLVTAEEITSTIHAIQKYGAAATGKKVVDTIKEIHKQNYIKTHDREKLRATQTPQGGRIGILKKALSSAKKGRKSFTDEAALMENIGVKVRHIDASPANFKITTHEDYLHAKALLGDFPENFLVGIGQDSHEFDFEKKGLIIGGIYLKDEPVLSADSDGDVILHALGNSILQALGKESLGSIATPLFKEKNIRDSKTYLAHILAKMKKAHYEINNIGLMLEGRRPYFDQIAADIRTSLAHMTGVQEKRIGITATTGKNLTSFGQGKGIQCFAIVSLSQTEN